VRKCDVLNAAPAAFAALGLIWGSNFIFMKWASDTLTAGQITFLPVLFGFLPVLVYALARGALSRAHLRYAHHFAVMSLLVTSVYYFAFAKGTSLLPSGIAGALSGAIAIVSLVAAAALLRGEATLAAVTNYDGITGIRHDPRAAVALVVGLGLLGTGIAYILYYRIVERLGAVVASSATYIPPVVALLIGWLLVDEPIDGLDLAAMLLILSGSRCFGCAAVAGQVKADSPPAPRR
jgi:drug/metabolite transporter (DMT)-like permease